ncbi:MAG TPA: translation initiation factor [Pirellulales bacterium]|nr:translation initiation factor [Pirellulales bacterium]
MRLFEGTPWDRPPRCDRCGQLEVECVCPPEPPRRIPPERQTARLTVEKRPKGKLATVVRGLPAEGNDLAGLLTQLKNACGAGGTVKDETIELQGRHLERVREVLRQIGYRVSG